MAGRSYQINFHTVVIIFWGGASGIFHSKLHHIESCTKCLIPGLHQIKAEHGSEKDVFVCLLSPPPHSCNYGRVVCFCHLRSLLDCQPQFFVPSLQHVLSCGKQPDTLPSFHHLFLVKRASAGAISQGWTLRKQLPRYLKGNSQSEVHKCARTANL